MIPFYLNDSFFSYEDYIKTCLCRSGMWISKEDVHPKFYLMWETVQVDGLVSSLDWIMCVAPFFGTSSISKIAHILSFDCVVYAEEAARFCWMWCCGSSFQGTRYRVLDMYRAVFQGMCSMDVCEFEKRVKEWQAYIDEEENQNKMHISHAVAMEVIG